MGWRTLSGFRFDLPDGWDENAGNGRVVFHGPSGEELIFSSAEVAGAQDATETRRIRDRLLQNAVRAAESAVSHPDLRVTRGIEPDARSNVHCLSVEAETLDGTTFFSEMVFVSDTTVILATLESPNSPEARAVFVRMLASASAAENTKSDE